MKSNTAIDVGGMTLEEKIKYIERLNVIVDSIEKDRSLPFAINKAALDANVGNLKLLIEMKKQMLNKG